MATSNEDRVCVGAVAGVRGLKGEVRIKSFTADPDDVAAYGPVTTEDASQTFKVKVVGHAKGLLIARLSGVSDRTAAEALKSTRLYVQRSALPKVEDDAYYHADLVGLAAETETGVTLGLITAVHNFGAGDILEIAGEDGAEDLMVPFTKTTVPEIDIATGRIVIVPPVFIEADENDEGLED
ncbi:MAG: 16S rRNA processing protein RimM [Alphaproteobacteria bacterium]|jgi:16S rRNA processing protein RimM|nr:16S rRNA processing protein RimM [Alphaproteobacteria bacterium]MBT7943745.1 16S rRNA processing protein RimM [Alphaproteobacteria bacterium]